jgi:murein DD-endopeptidase MepM/ murein hydrolase activator NlpD
MEKAKRHLTTLKDLGFAGKKLFVLSKTTLEYREIRFFRTKILLSGSLLSLLIIGVLLIANHRFNDVLGLGYNESSLLALENQLLKRQLAAVSDRMEIVQSSIRRLADRGNDLRLMVDLPPIDDDTRYVGVGGSDELPDLTYVTEEANGILRQSQTLVDQLSREVQLQKTSYQEILDKYAENQELFEHIPSIKPVSGSYSIVGFGMRVHPVLGIRRMHEGLDLIVDVGTNVYAAADGTVRYAGRTQGGYGTVIEVAHGFGYSTLYAHLSRVHVRPGQHVKRGELVARSGRSGLVSGPHLHYEVKYRGRKVNPVDYFFDDVEPSSYLTQVISETTR